jgi:hypothetical protein
MPPRHPYEKAAPGAAFLFSAEVGSFPIRARLVSVRVCERSS